MTGASRFGSIACVLLLAAVFGAARGQATAQELPAPRSMALPDAAFRAPDPTPLQQRLDNGLTAYVVADDRVPLVRYTALIGAGSADGAGAADYAAALRAGPALREVEFARALRQMAALFEVLQGHTETRVTLEVPMEDAAAALDWFAALLRDPHPVVPNTDVPSAVDEATGESGPVLYEGSLDTAVQLLERAVYEGHPYAGGYREGAPASVSDFVERFAFPANIVLAVSGDLDVASMRADLVRAFGSWDATASAPAVHAAASAPTSRRVLLYPADKLQGWVAIGHELPTVPAADEAALIVMNYILGGGHFDTRLFRATRDRRGLTNDDSGFPEPGFRGPGLYSFRTYGRPEVVRLLIHLTIQEIERIRTEPVTEEELFVAKGALADGEFSLWFRNGAATATTYAHEWLRHREHGAAASWPQRVREVTAAGVLAAARRYLHPERMQIVVVGPLEAINTAAQLEDEPPLATYGEIIESGRQPPGWIR